MPGEIAAIYEAGGIGFRKAIGGLPILYFMTHSRTTHLKEGRRSEHRSPMSPCWQVPYRVANWVAGPLLPPKSKILLWEMVIVLSEAIIFIYLETATCKIQWGRMKVGIESHGGPLCPDVSVPRACHSARWADSRAGIPVVWLSETQLAPVPQTVTLGACVYHSLAKPC